MVFQNGQLNFEFGNKLWNFIFKEAKNYIFFYVRQSITTNKYVLKKNLS